MVAVNNTLERALGIEILPTSLPRAVGRALLELAALLTVARAIGRISEENMSFAMSILTIGYGLATAWLVASAAAAERNERVEWLWSRGGVTRRALARKRLRSVVLSSLAHGIGTTLVLRSSGEYPGFSTLSATTSILLMVGLQYLVRSGLSALVHSRSDTRLGKGWEVFWWIGFAPAMIVLGSIYVLSDFGALNTLPIPWVLTVGAAACLAQTLILERAIRASEFSTPEPPSQPASPPLAHPRPGPPQVSATPDQRTAAEPSGTPAVPVWAEAPEWSGPWSRRRPYSPMRTLVGAGTTDPCEGVLTALFVALVAAVALVLFQHVDGVRWLAGTLGGFATVGLLVISWRGVFAWSRDPEKAEYLYQSGVSLTRQRRLALAGQSLADLPAVVLLVSAARIAFIPSDLLGSFYPIMGIIFAAWLLRSLGHCNVSHWSTRAMSRKAGVGFLFFWGATLLRELTEAFRSAGPWASTVVSTIDVLLIVALLSLATLAVYLWARAILTSNREDRMKRELWDPDGRAA